MVVFSACCDDLRLEQSLREVFFLELLRLLLQIELLGRTQRQEQDNAWYTCINHVRVLGKPLHNFVPASPQTQDPAEASSSSAPKRCPQQGVKIEGVPLVLEARREDPMVARGGLMALSEGGLLLQRLATEAQGALQPNR